MNIYYTEYEDGTNTFPIIDNVINPFINNLQNQIDNINYNTSNLITNEYSVVFDPNGNYNQYCTIVNNSNIGGEIRFFTPNSYLFNDILNNYCTKIGQDGRLYVYHNFNINNFAYGLGWKDVEAEIAGLFEFKIDTIATLALLSSAVFYRLDNLDYLVKTNAEQFNKLMTDLGQARNYQQMTDVVNGGLSYILSHVAEGIMNARDKIGYFFFICGAISFLLNEHKKYDLVKDLINSNIYLNQQDKENTINYTSNVIQTSISDEYNKTSSNLNYFLGFTTQKQVNNITNEILDNFIDTNQTNNINYSSLNSYPSKIPTTIYTTSTAQVLGQWNAKKRFNLDYTGISYGIGDYYLYYNTASTNTFINCFDGNNSTFGEFSSIYTANVYDDFLNSQNVYSLGDFSDRGNVLIIQLPYKISLNSISLRSASDYIGCPINYSIYGANDLDIFYKLHQTIDLTPSIDYPSPNYINTVLLSQDSEFYNTFGFIFKKAYQHAPRIYELKLYGYEISSRRTLLKNNVGIGTNNPLFNLHIVGNEKINGDLYVQNIGINTTDPYERLHIVGGNAQIDGSVYSYNMQTSLLLITDKIGMGTTNPSQKLHIVGGNILLDGNVNTNTLTTNSINSLVYLGTNVGIGTTTTSYKLEVNGSLKSSSLQTNSINSLIYINDTYNNIGIGKTNPNFLYKVDVNGDARFESLYFEVKYPSRGGVILNSSMTAPLYNNNSGTLNFVNNSGTYICSIGDCADSGYMSNYLDILYSSPILGLYNKGNFIVNGNVGIGQTNALSNPSEKLDVIGNIKCSANIKTATLNTTGNVGIGITNPTNILEVSTTAKFSDITLTSYIDCYRNTTGSPSNGIYGSTADRIILQRGTISSHPFSVGIGTNNIYYNVPSTNRHSFMINGTTKFEVKGSGMVVNSVDGTDILNIMNDSFTAGIGIGTNTISSISDVADSITIKSKLTGDINLMTNSVSRLSILGSGNVKSNSTIDCSGTTALQPKLKLTGIEFYDETTTSTDGIGLVLGVNRTNNRQLLIVDTANLTKNTTNATLQIYPTGVIRSVATNGTTLLSLSLQNNLYILSSGNVGVGNTNPSYLLDVSGTINTTGKYMTTNVLTGTPTTGVLGGNGDRIILYNGATGVHPYSLGINASTLWYSVPTGAKHSFYINGTEYMTINTGGSINVVSADTYIASFKHTNLTEGLGLKYNSIEAIGTNATQNITIKSKSTGNIYMNTNGSTQLMVSGTGGVEIQNYLKVYADTKTLTASTATYINTTSTNYFSGGSYSSTNVCAEFGSSIWIYGSLWVASDERIKKEIIDLNQDDSLNKILKLKPKSYKYIDIINNGNSNNYGFIAQEVKEIIPEAVSYKKSFVPNIYEIGYYYDSGVIVINKSINNILNIDDKLKIYDDKGIEIICNITEIINHNSFKIDNKKLNCNKVLVYGTEIEDFNILDKEMIFSLNISATQRLYQKIIELENRIKELESVTIINKSKN